MIVTSEGVELDIAPVGIVARTLAKLLDVIIQTVAYLIVVAIAAAVFPGGGLPWEGVVFLAVMAFLVVLGYPVVMESVTRGRTVGKLALGLRTVTTGGMPIRFRHAAVRGVFELVDLWLTFGAVGMPVIVWSGQHQRLGDLVAGTVVVRDRKRGVLAGARFTVPPGMEGVASGLDVSALPEDLYELLRSYLLRWNGLERVARTQVGTTLADRVAASIGFTPTPMVTPDLFLTTVAACYQSRFAPAPAPAPAPARPGWSWAPAPEPAEPAPPGWNASPAPEPAKPAPPGWNASPAPEQAADPSEQSWTPPTRDEEGFTPIA